MYAQSLSHTQSLRQIYELELGEAVSDRTWQRLKSPRRLCFNDEDFDRVADIRIAARMRRRYPKSPINIIAVRRVRRVLEQFPDGICLSGEQLHDAIARVLGHSPHRSTLYRWGDELAKETGDKSCRFSKRAWYGPKQVKAWAAKIAPSAASMIA